MCGSFQASFIGISVMTGSVTFYLTMQWAFSCSLCSTEFGHVLLWEDGIACSWLQMFATHNVGVRSSAVAARYSVITSFMSLEFDIFNFLCILVHRFESSVQMPSELISQGFLVPY